MIRRMSVNLSFSGVGITLKGFKSYRHPTSSFAADEIDNNTADATRQCQYAFLRIHFMHGFDGCTSLKIGRAHV